MAFPFGPMEIGPIMFRNDNWSPLLSARLIQRLMNTNSAFDEDQPMMWPKDHACSADQIFGKESPR